MASSSPSSASSTDRPNKILLLGAGELGQAIISSIVEHPIFTDIKGSTLTIALRPSSLENPTDAQKALQTSWLIKPQISLHGLDLEATPLASLTEFLATSNFTTVIHAGGMTSIEGTYTKLARAVLDAKVGLYLPWQFGLDYDVIGPAAGHGLFAEQCGVRVLLREQTRTKYKIISCGMFMSFLFEQAWGVVVKEPPEDGQGRERIRVRPVGGWETPLTVTTAEDIGRATAEIALTAGTRDKPDDSHVAVHRDVVFIAGQTVTYSELADLLASVTGKEVIKDGSWTVGYLSAKMDEDPGNKLWRYRTVFGQGIGTAWPVEGTLNDDKKWAFEGIGEWLRRCWT
ncbi:hypothetical protein PV10_06778 [Exophiala mesophila]|uniref:NmrA-like domain-containing protein n=1 Tax=Exophiala mesophila TaxID=212818 RepID=A0A0D1XVP3_EXOME|nr:uncharacterized protein PV10_06778 [Exophiala mesophila]KIV92326.1 hypothetical protein PV10_06778 [Exophiala mesophila]